jgi:adenosylcobinamide-GDP ribazoletransferase
MLLTRLPVSRLPVSRLPVSPLGLTLSAEAFGRGIWAWPIVGSVVGAVSALTAVAARQAGLAAPFAAIAAVLASLLLTGALHEDGMADTADGLGGGTTRERKLAIMRDSRIGSFGAIALILTFAIRLAAIAAIGAGPPSRTIACLTVAATLGRTAMLIPLLTLSSARPDGMAAGLGRAGPARAITGLAIGLLTGGMLLPAGTAAWVIGLALSGALAMAWLQHRHLGGYTGDTLGATSVVVECIAVVFCTLPG